ncbi:glutaredoxin-like protein [Opitutaceae bacterium TAV1]|nr:glutaredoxin [Opitutaceae bacterium TAV5]EIQ01497.1 glutaredoxin-like protein [Opitutaceae bacterium TAV1]
MNPENLPILYIKSGCPWCEDAAGFLDEHGIGYRRKNIEKDPAARTEMETLSGQSKVPVLDWHGTVLTDFGTDELVPFLRSRNVKLEDS